MISKLIHGCLFYWCEGCKHAHNVPIDRWTWNNDLENPTISPSVRHFYNHPYDWREITTCHYWIKNGSIEYCGDCEHELKGQIRKLVDIPENYGLPQE